jgi:hypothetical protein
MLVTTYGETMQETLQLALRLTDRYTRGSELAGIVTANVAHRETANRVTADTFIFRRLSAGPWTIDVASDPNTPYYVPVSIPVTLPMPDALWPSYPDLSLADKTKMLDDPTQPAAYRHQRDLAALLPSAKYPFPSGATLVRGTVFAGTSTNPLGGATVRVVGGTQFPYLTRADGEFVLFFESPPHATQTVTLRASFGGKPDVDVSVDVRCQMTVTTKFIMAP